MIEEDDKRPHAGPGDARSALLRVVPDTNAAIAREHAQPPADATSLQACLDFALGFRACTRRCTAIIDPGAHAGFAHRLCRTHATCFWYSRLRQR